MTSYYNEFDPAAARWLRNLIAAGHIPPGEVDERSITDVRPDDLKGFTQCHFFAGIGGWSLALQIANWPDTRPVWTGSCPCQPFSVAGAQKGTADERHLWPAWFNLISECRPVVIFGEQVEAAIRHGWLDLVRTDLERVGYAVGAIGLPAAGLGAPHIRQRLWFVADAPARGFGKHGGAPRESGHAAQCNATCGSGDPEREGLEGSAGHGDDARGRAQPVGSTAAAGDASGLAKSNGGQCGRGSNVPGRHDGGGAHTGRQENSGNPAEHGSTNGPGPVNGFWRNADWLACRDGKWRPVEPGTFPLANGVSGRVVKLRAYGNAIVPQVAAALIQAYCEGGVT